MVSRRLPAGFQMHYLPIPTADELSPSSLTSSTPAPSRIYFNEYDHINEEKCIRYLGVGNGANDGGSYSRSREPRSPPANENQSLRQDRYPPSLTPLVERPLGLRDKHPWFYTSCPMHDVVEITCCRRCRAANDADADAAADITGMLLRYAGGGRACVGQYRPDRAASPIRADSTQTLSFRLVPVGEYARRVDEVRLRGAASRQPDASWMDVPWSGRLEWWFSLGQSWLSHSAPDS
jgi:hypothetical protein